MVQTISIQTNSTNRIVDETTRVLQSGGMVVFPSDTVYGLLVDATNEKAVQKLITFKQRPIGKAVSIFVSDFEMMKKYISLSVKQERLIHELLPGPFTIILPSKHKAAKMLESEKGTLGIRIPDYDSINQLIKSYGKPVTATSANLSGRSPHYSVYSLLNVLPASKRKLVNLIVDAGQLPRNKPSTVVDLTTGDIKIIRKGDIVFSRSQTFLSESPSQTKKVAKYILRKIVKNGVKKPLIIILEGPLGSGKTLFVKGVGELIGITNIVSPTFVIYYEYSINGNQTFRNLYHLDFYQIEDADELLHLGIEKMLQNRNLICIEWGERAGDILPLLKKKSKVIYVKIRYVDGKKRKIEVHY